MAAEVSIDGDHLVVHIHGIDRFLSFKGSLSIPLQHVSGASRAPEIPRLDVGVKLVGAGIPGLIRAGSYMGKGGLAFWDVRHHEKAIMIELHDEEYARLILEVDDPDATLARLQAALG